MTLRENIKSVIEQRLAVVAEQIFLAVERVLSDYEKEDFCCKQRVEDQRRAVDLMLNDHTGKEGGEVTNVIFAISFFQTADSSHMGANCSRKLGRIHGELWSSS